MLKFVSFKTSEDKEIKVLVSERMNEFECKHLKTTIARLAGANIYDDLEITNRNGDVILSFNALYYASDEHQPLNLTFRPSGL